MIDFVKLSVVNSDSFENYLLSSRVVNLNTYIDNFSGEIKDYPKIGKLKNLEIRVNPVNSIIKGSLHKYENLNSKEEDQNYDDFTYCQFSNLIPNLTEKLHIENNTSLSYLEFGFNLKANIDPQKIIDDRVLMLGFKNHSKDLKYGGKGDFKEFIKTDYSLKIYNKSKQYKLDSNILRIELKIRRKRLLQKLNIYKLEDLLDKQLLTEVFNVLWNQFDVVMIIDDFCEDKIPQNDIDKLNRFTNPNYWQRIRNTKSPKIRRKLKNEFNRLLGKYELDKTKKELKEKLKAEFLRLLNEDCNSKEVA